MAHMLDIGRSVMAQRFFEDCAQFKDGKLEVSGTVYQGVTGEIEDFSSRPVASMGSSATREVILLDGKNSPFLNAKFNELSNALAEKARLKMGPLTEEEVVQAVHTFVQKEIFNKGTYALDEFIIRKRLSEDTEKVWVGSTRVTCIPLDDFAKAGLGVCRHHALTTAYLIHQLTTGPKPLLKGIVQQIRSNVDGCMGSGAHVWTSYVNHEQRMHIDTLWGVFDPDFQKSESQRVIEVLYGSKAYSNEVEKTTPTFLKARQAYLRYLQLQVDLLREQAVLREKERMAPVLHVKPEEGSTSLKTHTLDWVRVDSYRNKFFSRFNQLAIKANSSQDQYDQLADALSRSMKVSGTPAMANIDIYLTALYKEVFKPYAGMPAKDRPKGMQIIWTALHKEVWNIALESDSLNYKSPNDSKVLVDLKTMMEKLKSGTLDKDTFDQLPTIVKNAIFGKTYLIQKNAGRPTYADTDFGRRAFLGEGRTVSSDVRVAAIQSYILDVIANLFLHGEEREAMEVFNQLDKGFRSANVYGSMWEVCGKSKGDPHFGSRAFQGEKSGVQGDRLRLKRVEALQLAQKKLGS